MITEKERIVSNENYEISKKIYFLFKKYENYDKQILEKQNVIHYNPDDLFKNKNTIKFKTKTEEVSLVEIKKDNWFINIFKNLIKYIFR